ANTIPATRYLCSFPIGMLYDGVDSISGQKFYRLPSVQSPEESRFLSELGGDIMRSEPEIVLLDTSDAVGCPAGFHVNGYLEACGWDSLYLAGYRRSDVVGIFESWRRNEKAFAMH